MLLDSNILIYAVQPEHAFLRERIGAGACRVSAVCRLEALGYHRLSTEDRADLEAMFKELEELPVDAAVIDRAILLRQARRLSLGDALTAATALVHDLTLVTRNTEDFDWIPGLKLWNPFVRPSPPTSS